MSGHFNLGLRDVDPEVYEAINRETERQNNGLELIASENFASKAVMEAIGSVMTNKYAEGYPGKRYYGGCEYYDVVENLAIERAKKLFSVEHANVQPHSGTQANMAVYFTAMTPGDTLLGMNLSHGGHLSHGLNINFSGKFYKAVFYGVGEDGYIDYNALEKIASENKPRLIVAGASAYPREVDFRRFRAIADKTGALLMADIAHIAGLVAAKIHQSSIPYAHYTTTTTHKTLRGPRGGMILCGKEYAKDLDRVVFPGVQGGPLMNTIAAKAVCFKEALTSEFVNYQKQIKKNATALAERLMENGFKLVSGGTDNHLMLVDLTNKGLTGKEAQEALGEVDITVNKNTIPFEKQSPFITSGIRIGTPCVTTRGMRESEMVEIADVITKVLNNIKDSGVKSKVKSRVREFCGRFPVYVS